MGYDSDSKSSVVQKALLLICCYGLFANGLQALSAGELKKIGSAVQSQATPTVKLPSGHEYRKGSVGNPCAKHYEVSPGHPPFEPRARFLGVLEGAWHEIGHQIGTKAGDLVRWVSDVWWKEHTEKYGLENTMKALPSMKPR